MKPRDILVAGAVALSSTLLFALPYFDRLEGLSIDALGALRQSVFGRRTAREQSPAAVIAIDEETYQTPPFRDIPKVMWTKQLAAVLNATLEGGAAVVGFDVIFPTSVERYIRGFDREFLIALRNGARAGKVVLGKVQHQVKPISPFAGQSFAVGHEKNIRLLNLFEDPDGIIRRVPLTFRSEDRKTGLRVEHSMALELAARKLKKKPVRDGSNGITLGSYRIPGSERNAMPLNFTGAAGAIPTYSFADLYACAAKGRADYFRKHFGGKVVMIGVALDVEDRKLTSMRLMTEPEGNSAPERCALPSRADIFRGDVSRDSIPGVYIQATAINNLLRRDALSEFSPLAYTLISLPFAIFVAALTLVLAPVYAGAGFLLGGLLWTGAAIAAFQESWVLPFLGPLYSGGVTCLCVLGYRVVFLESDKRFIRTAFSTYLSPKVVAELVKNPDALKLGGERKEITAFFSDVAGFTSVSESLSPEELVGLLNEYLSEMTDIILRYDGTVDKYEGDAIVAFFGAPQPMADHAACACFVCLDMQARMEELRAGWRARGMKELYMRIGLNTGPAVVGNMGSRTRMDYTMMGDTVNAAARFEGANKEYATSIMIGDQTYQLAKEAIEARELDLINVVGKSEPLPVYELLSRKGELDPAKAQVVELYRRGLECYRGRKFEEATGIFAEALALDGDDGPSITMKKRSEFYISNPPPDGWSGAFEMTSK